jgi:hypothetical protein
VQRHIPRLHARCAALACTAAELTASCGVERALWLYNSTWCLQHPGPAELVNAAHGLMHSMVLCSAYGIAAAITMLQVAAVKPWLTACGRFSILCGDAHQSELRVDVLLGSQRDTNHGVPCMHHDPFQLACWIVQLLAASCLPFDSWWPSTPFSKRALLMSYYTCVMMIRVYTWRRTAILAYVQRPRTDYGLRAHACRLASNRSH